MKKFLSFIGPLVLFVGIVSANVPSAVGGHQPKVPTNLLKN